MEITGLTHDSRQAQPGDLFVALPGANVPGWQFVPTALARGAVAVAGPVEAAKVVPQGVPFVRLDVPRRATAELAASFHGHPSRALKLVGVTGTNGKTTVTSLVAAMIHEAGLQGGFVGTVGYRVGSRQMTAAAHTTPESPTLQSLLAEMVTDGVEMATMEVSSIGLAEWRVHAVEFSVAAFLNLSPDHLDYHGTMEAYGEAKVRLFEQGLAPSGTAIVDVSGPFGQKLWARLNDQARWARLWRIGHEIHFDELTLNARGMTGQLRTPAGPVRVQSPLLGRFNTDNVAAAVACGLAVGLPIDAIERGLSSEPPRGRLERVPNTESLAVVVDYAHTPDALRRVLEAVRPATRGAIWCVIGCGGDRDAAKRSAMGKAAAAADAVIVTNDNPRTEPPEIIAATVAEGARAAGRALISRAGIGGTFIELDRRQAIRAAIVAAQPGDTVLIAGKGHETYQEVDGFRRSFDDVAEARAALALRKAR